MPFSNLLKYLSNTRILVIGDIMLDHYLWGDIHRISPEAPVPVVHAHKDTFSAGGAANVALNLANLGVQTSILGHLKNDEAGLRLAQILNDSGVKRVDSLPFSDAPTIIKTRVIVRNQQLCRIDREESRELYRIDRFDRFGEILNDTLDNVDAVIISDYAKGVITQSLIDAILNKARKKSNLLVSIDPKPSRQLSFKGVGLLTPNRNEALELAGLAHPHHDDPYPLEEACHLISEKYNPDLLVITLGAEGMAICKHGKILKHLATEAREVFDVSGAGDTVIATLTAALAAGLEPHRAAWLANGAAGCVVAHMGTVPIALKELTEWLAKAP